MHVHARATELAAWQQQEVALQARLLETARAEPKAGELRPLARGEDAASDSRPAAGATIATAKSDAEGDWNNWKDDDDNDGDANAGETEAVAAASPSLMAPTALQPAKSVLDRVKDHWDGLLSELENLDAPLDDDVMYMASSRIEGQQDGGERGAARMGRRRTPCSNGCARVCEVPRKRRGVDAPPC